MGNDRAHWEGRYQTPSGSRPEAEPSAFLVENADLIRGLVLDLACGAGRNAVYLARRGNIVEAFDIAFAGLLQARQAAVAEGLNLRLVQTDLQYFPLPLHRYDAVINIRYLQRSLFPSIMRALKPGGVLLFETFLIDQKQFGHPRNPDFLLQHGELHAAFHSLEQIRYEEGLVTQADGSAYLARLLARRAD